MKSFRCQNCSQIIFFENAQCLRCGSALGYLPATFTLSALTATGEGCWRAVDGGLYTRCKNGIDWQNCNWMVPFDSQTDYCVSCDLNETIPNLSSPVNLEYWRTLEQGKRRLVYGLMRFGLPLPNKKYVGTGGLAFEFLKEAERPRSENDRVMTGHANGKITVNIAEADDLERERIRLNLNEVYRSVLGHFRHESGHFYWWYLVQNSPRHARFQHLFGDERVNYEQAIRSYYANGPAPNWENNYVSAYSSSHPWEDWAESWAHYLTIVDALETAQGFGVEVTLDHTQNLFPTTDSYRAYTFDEMLQQWLPLTYAVNSINRSAGQSDLYPFVLPGPAIDKLRFVHDVIRSARVA